MANNTPPLWLLRQTILSGGGRLEPNKPEWKDPKIIPPVRNFERMPLGPAPKPRWKDRDGIWMTLENNKIVPLADGSLIVLTKKDPFIEPGNLPKSEYFQWIGARMPLSSYGMCRACGKSVWNPDARIAHKGEGCGRYLAEAYKLLREDKHRPTGQYLCTCCSQATSKLMWGIPICSTKCEELWRFGDDKVFPGNKIPTALADALRLVKKRLGK